MQGTFQRENLSRHVVTHGFPFACLPNQFFIFDDPPLGFTVSMNAIVNILDEAWARRNAQRDQLTFSSPPRPGPSVVRSR